ncbi:hypothetical protein [Nonomuraea africana]|uniref:Uncharacterized protein n=1 Tax=Nonomuraea africana TaxID=46171 RepID=A0ABR9KMN3_9ACTN|nr:hypothetical protein [Nonomuraea africana]MBE1563270.1 hypothetical protein [Nonomuraea africana]
MSEMEDVVFEPEELSIEAPEADAAEQLRLLREEERVRGEVPIDVDPADAFEQDRTVGDDDDEDYR